MVLSLDVLLMVSSVISLVVSLTITLVIALVLAFLDPTCNALPNVLVEACGEKLVGGGGSSVLFVFGFFGWRVWLRERRKKHSFVFSCCRWLVWFWFWFLGLNQVRECFCFVLTRLNEELKN